MASAPAFTSTFCPTFNKSNPKSVSLLKQTVPSTPATNSRNAVTMIAIPKPSVPADVRRARAKVVRENATVLAQRIMEESRSNDEENTVDGLLANFTKGFRHLETGQIVNVQDYLTFVRVIVTNGLEEDIKTIPLGPQTDSSNNPIWRSEIARTGNGGGPVNVRGWESSTAGNAFSLIGPDAQALSMPPAPLLTSDEAIAELAEIYAMALARDIPIADWETDPRIKEFCGILNALPWFADPDQSVPTPEEAARRRGLFTPQTLFRGILPGSETGPYLSQFLIIGSQQIGDDNAGDEFDGKIAFGANLVDLRVRIARPFVDYMTDMKAFLDVQDGADLRLLDDFDEGSVFIRNLRDLSTYVHFDQLYQAYFNACLTLLADGERFPFDNDLPFSRPDNTDRQQGFVLYGGPHILTLVAEVATRALKSVRYQKFNIHRRLRPEAAGGLVNVFKNTPAGSRGDFEVAAPIVEQLDSLLVKVLEHNAGQNSADPDRSNDPSYLLPMAFIEGSPMHPTYGSGHAVVAGACVTMLKAFFDEDSEFETLYEVDRNGKLRKASVPDGTKVTLGMELNKLADNISIGRDAAGVHWFSDQYESLLLGEAVAIQVLSETQLTLLERFDFNLTKFDGTKIRIDESGMVRTH